MNLGIVCSNADSFSKSKITQYNKIIDHASKNFDLVMSDSNQGLMKVCYDKFLESDQLITMVGLETNPLLEEIPASCKILCSDTFERTKRIMEYSDMLLFLTGGIETYAELYSVIEEKRVTQKNIPIILYNRDHCYDLFISCLNKLVNKGYADIEDKYLFTLVDNTYDLNVILDKEKRRRCKTWKKK